MRILSVQVILHNLHAQVKRRYGWAGDFNLPCHWVLGVADWGGEGGVVDDDRAEGDGDPAVRFVEVVLSDLGGGQPRGT